MKQIKNRKMIHLNSTIIKHHIESSCSSYPQLKGRGFLLDKIIRLKYMLPISEKIQLRKNNIGKIHANTNQKRISTNKQNKEYLEQRGSCHEESLKQVCTIKIAEENTANQIFNKEIKRRLSKELSEFKNKKVR